MRTATGNRTRTRIRDRERTTRAILDAALVEFSDQGYGGARIDAIAERSGASKPMIYSYFGDKNALYHAALRDAYVQIREGEAALELDLLAPKAAFAALVEFTLSHYRENPWFIRLLNAENQRGGDTIRAIDDVATIQSSLIDSLDDVLQRGRASGEFRAGVTPVELYITIASLCWFPLSNVHTLRRVFGASIDDAWLAAHQRDAVRMLLGFLAPES